MQSQQFIDETVSIFKRRFPHGWINGGLRKGLGGNEQIVFRFGIQPIEKHIGKIPQNDPGFSILVIEGIKDGELSIGLRAELLQGHALTVKPTEPHMAYGSVKFGWRNKKGNLDTIELHIGRYFKKMRNIVDENIDNLAHDIDG